MAQSNTRLSPRQKMINLMYIVLTAMLALNVSSDVLDGFKEVEDGLARTNETASDRNSGIYGAISAMALQNPEKGNPWLAKATAVRDESQRLYNEIDSLKYLIVRKSDGEEGDPHNIVNLDDLESAATVMLNPTSRLGEKLRLQLDSYSDFVTKMIADTSVIRNIKASLSTSPVKKPGISLPVKWEIAKFEGQPVVAAVTHLTKLQNDLRYAEGETLQQLLSAIDATDVRVNSLNAFVIPQSRYVMKGGKYSANIVVAAVDTTARPVVTINGRTLNNDRGLYEFTAGSAGNFDYSGTVTFSMGNGSDMTLPFKSSYTVMEPMASVSATNMNVLYAGIDNPISIAVPGIPMSKINASMTNGSLTRSGDKWVARPGKVGSDAEIVVTAQLESGNQRISSTKFRVRRLPDPTPFIPFNGASGQERYKGDTPISKASLMSASGLGAAIDDGILDTPFKVISFETVSFDSMNNAIPEVSDGPNFSSRQRESFRRLSRGKRFYISRIKVSGPDGTQRTLRPMEVIVN